MRALLDKLEPTLGPEEESYRLYFLQLDRAQLIASGLLMLASRNRQVPASAERDASRIVVG